MTNHSNNEPLDETEQKQLIEIVQLFMQLPERNHLELRLYADTSGSIYLEDKLLEHFHDLEEGVVLLQNWGKEEE